jgi:hypothetical protein
MTPSRVPRSQGIWYLTDRPGYWTRKLVFPNPWDDYYMQPSLALDEQDHVTIAAARFECRQL